MSHLLLVHQGEPGRVDVLLADAEATENGARVFRRRGEVVLRVALDEVVIVRDVRNRTRDRANASRDAAKPLLFGPQRSVAAR